VKKLWLYGLLLSLLHGATALAATYNFETGPQTSAAYPWEDTTGGTSLTLADDACSTAIGLGFTFAFGGTAYTSIGICSNGVLGLGGTTFTSYSNKKLPRGGETGLLLPFWDDLDPQGVANSASQGIRYLKSGTSPNRRFTVTYLRVPRCCSAGFYTFQVTLYEDGRFVYRYGYTSASNAPSIALGNPSDPDAGNSATIGYQASQNDYVSYSNNTSSVFNGDIVLWRPTTQQELQRADTTCGAPQQVSVTFATTVNKASAETVGNYSVSTTTGTVATVTSASLGSDSQTVALGLSSAVANQIYIVRVSGVQTTGGQKVYDAVSYTTGSAPASGLIGDYFAHGKAGTDTNDIFPYFSAINGKTHSVRKDSTINFSSGFFPGGGSTYFGTRWLGYLVPTTTAKYCLTVRGSDGVRLFLDGSSILDEWILQNAAYYTTSAPITLNAGQYYQLQEEFYSRTEQDVATLQWVQTTARRCPANPPAGSVAVPQANLYSCKGSTVAAFRISGGTADVNCTPAAITIAAVDAAGNAVTSFTGTIALSTNTGHGTWSLNSGNGSFSAGAADSGAATYTFVASDNGDVVLNLSDAHPESVNVNAVSGSVTVDPAYDPNFVFQPTGMRLWANGVAGASIPNQVAGFGFTGGTFQLEVVGTGGSGSCTSLLNNAAQPVGFALECQNPTSCSTGAGNASLATVNGTSIKGNNSGGVSNYTTLNLNFVNGFATVSFGYADAGQIAFYANTRVTTGGSTANLTWSSNALVVRPFGFCIVPSSSTNSNPNATDANGAVFTTAGSSFNTTIKAVAWQAADDTNNDGVPDTPAANPSVNLCDTNAITPNFGRHTTAPTVILSSALQQPAPGNAGTLSGNTTITTAFNSPSNGQFQGTLNWSDVGIITLNATSSNYLSSGMNITGARYNVGRFTPHHFAIGGGNLTNRTDLSCSLSTFTYLGERLDLGFTLTAQNASNGTTQNYQGSFAKLQSFSALNTAAISLGSPRTALTPASSAGLSGGWSNGVWNVVAPVQINRTATPSGPFGPAAFGAAPQDTDGIGTNGFNLDTNATADGVSDHVQIGGTTNLFYGRLRLNSASGPSDLGLPIPVAAEYWNGSQFVTNASDSCTPVNGASATLSNFRNYQGSINSTTPSGSATLSAGQSQAALLLSAPGAGNYGSVDISLNLSTSQSWLEFDWNNDGTFDPGTTATASFGTYRGSDRVIYWQEIP
jgi:hypothetical protein